MRGREEGLAWRFATPIAAEIFALLHDRHF